MTSYMFTYFPFSPQSAAIIVSHTFYICVINYYVVLASIPFFALVIIFTLYCVRAIRDTKRIESECKTTFFECTYTY